MKSTITPDQIAKLPKWAQSHIEDQSRQITRIEAELKRFVDDQTPSEFYIDDWFSPTRNKRYVQAPNKMMAVEHAGVRLDIFCPDQKDSQRLYGVEIRFCKIGDSTSRELAIVPRSTGTIQILTKENL